MVTSIPSWVYHIPTFSATQLFNQITLFSPDPAHTTWNILTMNATAGLMWRLGWRPALALLDFLNGISISLLLDLEVHSGALDFSASVLFPVVTDWAPDMTTTLNTLLLGDLLALSEATGTCLMGMQSLWSTLNCMWCGLRETRATGGFN